MTTIADPGLECDLLLKLIKTSDQSTGDLIQSVYDWVGKRLMCPDPGFGNLGPVLEKFCNRLHLAHDEQQVVQTKVDISLKMLPAQIQEVERIYNIMRDRHGHVATDDTTIEKITKLVEWKDARINALKSSSQELQNDLNCLMSSTKSTIMEMIEYVRSGGDAVVVVEDSQVVESSLDPVLLAEVEKMFGDTPAAPTDVLRLPTLVLGEDPEPSKGLGEVAAGAGGGEDVPTPMELLPDNQMGDPTIFPPVPMDTPESSETVVEPPSIKRLIVPPGHDVPIKQTMVDIFTKTRETPQDTGRGSDGGLDQSGVTADGSEPKIATQDADRQKESGDDGKHAEDPKPAEPTPEQSLLSAAKDGTLVTSTCEEQALNLIAKLEDGPTKQALMSLCEASLVKVGLMRETYIS